MAIEITDNAIQKHQVSLTKLHHTNLVLATLKTHFFFLTAGFLKNLSGIRYV